MNVRSHVRRAAVAAATLLMVAALVGPASAQSVHQHGTRTVINSHGSCSGPTSWKLSVKRSSGTLDVMFTGSGGDSGQKWNIFMDDNHQGFWSGSRVSQDGGYFIAKASTKDKAGSDKIVVGASNSKTGETCRGRVTV